jgi:FAD binding domain
VLSVGTWMAGHALVAQRFQRGRVFIAGDAAHLFTPTGGLGYNTAVEDAVNLGWKIASVLSGSAPEGLLTSYEPERKPVAERNTAYARQFADSIGLFVAKPELDDHTPAGHTARAAASAYLDSHARLEFNIPGVTFGARYDRSPLIVKDRSTPPPDAPNNYTPSASPGGRAPHAWLGDGRSLYDSFNFEWTLLALGPNPPDPTPFQTHAESLHLDLHVVKHDSPKLLALYEAPLVLVRPDQIVAWRGNDPSLAQAVLKQVTGDSRETNSEIH